MCFFPEASSAQALISNAWPQWKEIASAHELTEYQSSEPAPGKQLHRKLSFTQAYALSDFLQGLLNI